MAVTVTRSIGMLLLAIWLIVDGIQALGAFGLPTAAMGALALLAGVFILIGR